MPRQKIKNIVSRNARAIRCPLATALGHEIEGQAVPQSVEQVEQRHKLRTMSALTGLLGEQIGHPGQIRDQVPLLQQRPDPLPIRRRTVDRAGCLGAIVPLTSSNREPRREGARIAAEPLLRSMLPWSCSAYYGTNIANKNTLLLHNRPAIRKAREHKLSHRDSLPTDGRPLLLARIPPYATSPGIRY